MESKRKEYLLLLLAVVLIIASGSSGYYFGTQNPKIIIIKGVDRIQDGAIKNVDFGIFWETWDLIQKNYLRSDEIKNQELIYGSAAGLVNALNDPYTVFLKPEDSKRFADDIRGAFGGIGAEIGARGDYIVVIAPLKNSPAEKVGLKAGDKILAVNSSSTLNISIGEVVKMIRGVNGTEVTLLILGNGDEKPKDVKITRAIIKIPTVEWEMKENNIAHIQLFNFNEFAPKLFVRALNESLRAGAQSLILDLRNNPGGFLEVAVSLAGIFVESGKEVVAEEFGSGQRNPFVARGNAVLKDFPMVILINKGSASASEILAGAIRHYKEDATIIGETSFGKGTVQELKELPDGSTLKITVAHWVLPDGNIIEGNGIVPDIEVKITDEDREGEKDPQLDKAIEILKKVL